MKIVLTLQVLSKGLGGPSGVHGLHVENDWFKRVELGVVEATANKDCV